MVCEEAKRQQDEPCIYAKRDMGGDFEGLVSSHLYDNGRLLLRSWWVYKSPAKQAGIWGCSAVSTPQNQRALFRRVVGGATLLLARNSTKIVALGLLGLALGLCFSTRVIGVDLMRLAVNITQDAQRV